MVSKKYAQSKGIPNTTDIRVLVDNAIPILSYFGLYKIVTTRFWSLMVDHNEDQSYLIDSDNTHSYTNSIKPIIVRG